MRLRPLILFLALAGCGFGLYDDSGQATPDAGYWGWLCLDGTQPDPDAGCLPQTCSDCSTPSLSDAGACVCANGSAVLPSTCLDGGT